MSKNRKGGFYMFKTRRWNCVSGKDRQCEKRYKYFNNKIHGAILKRQNSNEHQLHNGKQWKKIKLRIYKHLQNLFTH